jgi:hypothetical protein
VIFLSEDYIETRNIGINVYLTQYIVYNFIITDLINQYERSCIILTLAISYQIK